MLSLQPPLPSACAASHASRGFWGIALLRHATPVKACTSLAVSALSFPDISPNAFAPSAKHLSGFWQFLSRSRKIPYRIPRLESTAGEFALAKQRKTRQNSCLLVMYTNGFWSEHRKNESLYRGI